jgi:hypothetical protein
MAVLLPCSYEGGHVRFSRHQSRSKRISASKDATLDTWVIAWYNEVAYEAEPLTSGYRLALPFRVYLLSRHYAEAEVNKLHSPDYLKVKHLLPLAGELGFTVSFATLTYVVEGYNHDVRLPDFPRQGRKGEANQSGSTYRFLQWQK